MNFDTASAHQFDSWTDNDLYRAIENPEIQEPGPARDAELTEYVEELRRRAAARAADAQRRHDLNVKYGIPLDPASERPWERRLVKRERGLTAT